MAHPDFREILEYAHFKQMNRIDVFTNATLIDEALKQCKHHYKNHINFFV